MAPLGIKGFAEQKQIVDTMINNLYLVAYDVDVDVTAALDELLKLQSTLDSAIQKERTKRSRKKS